MLPERRCFLRCAGPATFLPHPLERLINPEAECNSWLLSGPLPTQRDSSGLCTLLMVLCLVPSTQRERLQTDTTSATFVYQSSQAEHVTFAL